MFIVKSINIVLEINDDMFVLRLLLDIITCEDQREKLQIIDSIIMTEIFYFRECMEVFLIKQTLHGVDIERTQS